MTRVIILILIGVMILLGIVGYLYATKSKEKFASEFSVPTPGEFYALSPEERRDIIESYSAYSARDAWKYLKEVGLTPGAPSMNTHTFGHIVGNQLYHQMGAAGFLICDRSFVFACNHGIVEEAVLNEGKGAIDNIVAVCNEEAQTDTLENGSGGSCFHGVGHALILINEFDLDTSLDECVEVFVGEKFQMFCFDGVFMEYTQSFDFSRMTVADAWQMCQELEKPYQSICGYWVPVMEVGFQNSTTTPQNIPLCMSAPTDNLKLGCIHSIGKRISNNSISHIPLEEVESRCSQFESRDKDDCLVSAAFGYHNNRIGDGRDENREFADEICKLISDDHLTIQCIKALEYRVDESEYSLTTIAKWRTI